MKKKIDVLLINPPPWDITRPPLGLGYLETCLEKNNISVDVLDLNIELFHLLDLKLRNLWQDKNAEFWRVKYFSQTFAEIKNILNRILHEKFAEVEPTITAISVADPKDLVSIEIIKEIKRIIPRTNIILGGPSTNIPETREVFLSIDNLISCFVVGEGEQSIIEIVQKIKNNESIENVQNIVTSINGKEKINPRQDLNIVNKIDFPKYKHFPMDKYTTKTLALFWTRGCIGSCTFCKEIRIWPTLSIKEPQKVVNEILYHYKKNKIDYFSFWDSAINSNVKKLEELCDLLIKEKLRIKWDCLCIARKEMTSKIMKKMSKAGCVRIIFGIESGSNTILRKIRKMSTSEIGGQVLKNSKQAGIMNCINIIVGYPGEKEREFQETIDFINKNHKNIDFIEGLQPFQYVMGTEIFEKINQDGVTFPKHDFHDKWQIKKDGNTHKVRYERLDRLIKLFNEKDIPIGHSRLKEDKIEENDKIKKRISKRQSFLEKLNYNPKEDNLVIDIHRMAFSGDILLINSPPWGVKELPMALGYIAEYLLQKGLTVKVLDLNSFLFNNTPAKLHWIWHVDNKDVWQNQESLDMIMNYFKDKLEYINFTINESDVDIIGFSAVDSKEKIIMSIIKNIKKKKPETRIIIGGPAAQFAESRTAYEKVYDHISAFVVGEGESTILEIINRTKNNISIEDVPNTVIPKKGKNIINPKTNELNIKDIVFPKYELFDMNYYNRVIPLNWSRGCVNICVFCVEKDFWQGYRFREPEDCLRELKYHYKSGYNQFLIYDSIINGDIKKLNQLLDLIIKEKMDIKWRAHTVAFSNLNPELFKKLKKAGCHELNFGIESGSDKILKSMKKGYTSKQASKILQECKKSGIRTITNFIVGFPGETEQDFKETLNFIQENKNNISSVGGIATLQIVGGTDLSNNREEYGIGKQSNDSGNLWKIKNNNFKIRKRRANELIKLIKSLGIEYERANTLKDTPNETKKKIRKLRRITKQGDKPLDLFFQCLEEHDWKYTIGHTLAYLKKGLIK